MLYVMMMREEMGTVLIEEAVTCLLIKEAMVVADPQVHTVEIGVVLNMAVEIGVVLTMAVDLTQVLDLNIKEVLITVEMQAQSVMDIAGIRERPHVRRF